MPTERITVWNQFSLPLLVALAHQCSNTNREVRHQALSHFQRLLSPSVTLMGESPDTAFEDDVFNRAVFPLVDELLKPEVIERDPHGMSETLQRVSTMLCRVFLQFEVQPGGGGKDIRIIWTQVLDLLDRLMNRNKRDPLVCFFAYVCWRNVY
jgi:brefeldin A-resistance guanine nucleotide exchange factor 1